VTEAERNTRSMLDGMMTLAGIPSGSRARTHAPRHGRAAPPSGVANTVGRRTGDPAGQAQGSGCSIACVSLTGPSGLVHGTFGAGVAQLWPAAEFRTSLQRQCAPGAGVLRQRVRRTTALSTFAYPRPSKDAPTPDGSCHGMLRGGTPRLHDHGRRRHSEMEYQP